MTAGAWSLVALVAHSDAGVPVPVWMLLCVTGAALVVLCLLAIGLSAFSAPRPPETADARPGNARVRWVWWRSIACIALTLAAIAFLLPLKLRLFLSGPALRQSTTYLSQLPPDRLRSSRQIIGLFRVTEFARFGDELRFITSRCGLVDDCGVVFSPGGRPPNRGEDTFVRLYGEWWHWHRSW